MPKTDYKRYWPFLFGIVAIFMPIKSFCHISESKYLSLKIDNHKFRAPFDINYYELTISNLDFLNKRIQGKVDIHFEHLSLTKGSKSGIRLIDTIQIDLSHRFKIEKLVLNLDSNVMYIRDSDFIFIPIQTNYKTNNLLSIYYEGTPKSAIKAPWDGGFVWNRDSLKRNWIGIACEGEGASSWWPCKDYLGDEPDSFCTKIIVPDSLYAVSNGKLTSITPIYSNLREFRYLVKNSINLYNVTINLGRYNKIRDTIFIKNKNGVVQSLKTTYYFLDYHSKKASSYFPPKVEKMFEAFYYYFGSYPFYNDGYVLVETPYWGMEHQSCISYGNNFKDSFLGFPMDFILIHESAHEYFGNYLSMENRNEMWLQEGFTTLCETLYLKYWYGDSLMNKYINSQRKSIKNEFPIISNNRYKNHSDNDVYYKGAWYLWTLKNSLNNDELFFQWLKEYVTSKDNRIVTTKIFQNSFEQKTKLIIDSANKVFLNGLNYPLVEYKIKGNKKHSRIKYRLSRNSVDAKLPVWLFGQKMEPEKIWKDITYKVAKGHLKAEAKLLETKYLMKFRN